MNTISKSGLFHIVTVLVGALSFALPIFLTQFPQIANISIGTVLFAILHALQHKFVE